MCYKFDSRLALQIYDWYWFEFYCWLKRPFNVRKRCNFRKQQKRSWQTTLFLSFLCSFFLALLWIYKKWAKVSEANNTVKLVQTFVPAQKNQHGMLTMKPSLIGFTVWVCVCACACALWTNPFPNIVADWLLLEQRRKYARDGPVGVPHSHKFYYRYTWNAKVPEIGPFVHWYKEITHDSTNFVWLWESIARVFLLLLLDR